MTTMLRISLTLAMAVFATVSPAQDRNPFQRPGAQSLPVPGGAPGALPPVAALRGDDDKLWDSVELVAVSRGMILLRRPGASSSLAVEPGRPFLLAGETWVARLEFDRRVMIFRRDATDGRPVANLWLSGPPVRVQGVVQVMPGQGAPTGSVLSGMQGPASTPVLSGGQMPPPGGVQ